MATNTAATQARYHQTSQTHYVYKDVVYGPVAQTVSLGFVPAGSTIDDAYGVVAVGFNAGTSYNATIGTRAAPAALAANLNLASVGKKTDTTLATSAVLGPFLVDTELVAVLTPTGTAATTGAGRIIATYTVANG